MGTLLTIVGVVILLVVLIVLYRAIRATTHVISEEQRWVIYRLGRFHRVAGPGPVQILPGLDRVMQSFEVRDRPLEVTVPGIFAFGLPNDLTLNLWCSFDPVRAAGGDKDRLLRLVQLNDAERRDQVTVKARQALVNCLAKLQEQMPLPAQPQVMDQVAALAPGSPRYNTLINALREDLEQTLPSVGVLLDTSQPIILTKRGLSEEILEAIKRRRGWEMDSQWLTGYVEDLRRRFPDLNISRTMLSQILASLPGVDLGKVQRLLLEQEPGTRAEVEFEMNREGEGANVIVKPKQARTEPAQESVIPPPLTESDLAVLKRVPRGQRSQQLSA